MTLICHETSRESLQSRYLFPLFLVRSEIRSSNLMLQHAVPEFGVRKDGGMKIALRNLGPQKKGREICKEWLEAGSEAPIVEATSREEDESGVKILAATAAAAGQDDRGREERKAFPSLGKTGGRDSGKTEGCESCKRLTR